MSAEGIRLYDPTDEPRTVASVPAPRPASLAGKRVGILDNGKANAGIVHALEDISVVVVGGAGKHSCWHPTFGNGTRPTRRVIPRARGVR